MNRQHAILVSGAIALGVCFWGKNNEAAPVHAAAAVIPEAPSMSAAARPRPSAKPPAATTGVRDTWAVTLGMRPTVPRSGRPCPPASRPWAAMMSAPASMARAISWSVCTWQISSASRRWIASA